MPQTPTTGQTFSTQQADRELRIFIVAGEHSGDALGGDLMAAINRRLKRRVRYLGVGGEAMQAQGLVSQFPIEDVAVMGLASILPKLPRIVRRVYRTVAAAVAAQPDIVVIIDSPEFTHPIAKRIRRQLPSVPIIDYVSPTVWAWRPGRAKKMAAYVDHLLALLPFEPDAHAQLGGPPCTYIGHPLSEREQWIRDLDPEPLRQRLNIAASKPVLLVLPGSRRSEVTRLIDPFSAAVEHLRKDGRAFEVIIPTVPSVASIIAEKTHDWSMPPHIVTGEDDKFRAFKLARAALAASGTVTLQLAMAGTPMVVTYRVDQLALRLRFLVKVQSIVLANLVLGENAFPELIQEDCTPEKLASELATIMDETPGRAAQLEALSRIPGKMAYAASSPSETAAEIVLDYANTGRKV